MDQTADLHGFLVVYPEGVEGEGELSEGPGTTTQCWNAGVCCAGDNEGPDDVAFARAMLADLASHIAVDSARVYATGMSNGGFMSQLLGCEAADLFAAVAPVAGTLGIPVADCTPSRPMPILQFYGTEDELVLFESEEPELDAVRSFNGWGEINGCSGDVEESFRTEGAYCQMQTGCDAEVKVEMCALVGMGHCWPGQQMVCPFGSTSGAIDANERMWAFFSQQRLDG